MISARGLGIQLPHVARAADQYLSSSLAFRSLAEGIKGALAKPVRIGLANFRDLNDLTGDQFGYRIIPIRELKHLKRLLVCS